MQLKRRKTDISVSLAIVCLLKQGVQKAFQYLLIGVIKVNLHPVAGGFQINGNTHLQTQRQPVHPVAVWQYLSQTARLLSSFFPQTVRLLNSSFRGKFLHQTVNFSCSLTFLWQDTACRCPWDHKVLKRDSRVQSMQPFFRLCKWAKLTACKSGD